METVDIVPLRMLSQNLIELIQFYFLAWSTYHSSMRAAAIPIIFGGGLVWTAVMAFKFPEDKFKGVVGSLIVLAAVGILIAPAKDTSAMFPGGGQTPYPVANGTVWTFLLAGNVYGLFRSSTDSVFENSLKGEMGKVESNRSVKNAMLNDQAAENMVAAMKNSDGKVLIAAYMGLCNRAIEGLSNDEKKMAAAHGVGLAASNLIGVSAADRSTLAGIKSAAGDVMLRTVVGVFGGSWSSPFAGAVDRISSPQVVDKMVKDGLVLLDSIPENKNPFREGSQFGYRVPTKAYFDHVAGRPTTEPHYLDPSTYEGGKYMSSNISNGSNLPPDQAQANFLYPKNCRDAYELSNMVAMELNKSSDDGAWINDPVFKATVNLTAQAQIGSMANEESIKYMESLGLQPSTQQVSAMENISDNVMGGLIEVSAKVGEFMLRYKVPMMVSVSAMLAAALLVTFPLFAVMAVFLGPQILITFFKLVIFAFLIIYLNDLFLSMAAEILYFQKISSVQGFNTGFTVGMAATQAASTTKAVIFSALTVVEIAVARLILWDDAKALSGFKPGSLGTDRAASMAKTIGGVALGALTFGKMGAGIAKASSTKSATSSMTTAANKMSGSARVLSAAASNSARGQPMSGQQPTAYSVSMKGSLNPPAPKPPSTPPSNPQS